MSKLFLSVLIVGLSTSAFATTYNWDLVNAPGTTLNAALGNTLSVTGTGGTLVLSGFNPASTATALYDKSLGFDEVGIGLNLDPTGSPSQHEIWAGSFIQVNISGLAPAIKTVQFTIDSIQSGEAFTIYGTNTAGASSGTTLFSGTSAQDYVPINLPSSYIYLNVKATTGNVLLDTISATTNIVPVGVTPEPGTLALGFVAGLGLLSRKLLQRRASRKA